VTRFGAVIRADNVRRLRDARTLVDHGVVRVVDLRFHSERAEDPIEALPVDVVHVSLLGDWDESYLASLEREMATRTAAEYLEWSYLHFLDHRRDRFALALAAVADAPPGAVCVHCMGGRDRTGLVAALLLRLAGVAVDDVASDYAESEARLADDHARWVALAEHDAERARRLVFGHAPASVMREVLQTVEGEHGSVAGYLRAAGLTDACSERLRSRLRDEG